MEEKYTTSQSIENLRILFFSDWRIQPLDLLEKMLDEVGPIDLIIYGGDDVDRFLPSVQLPPEVEISIHEVCHWNSSHTRITNPKTVISHLVFNTNLKPWPDLRSVKAWDFNKIKSVLRPLETDNKFMQLAAKAKYGLCAIIGNDCRPEDKHIIKVPGVVDIHDSPQLYGGWGFVGIEGAIYFESKNEAINKIGYVTYPDSSVITHIDNAKKRLEIKSEQLVIVSHTPPQGCLDVGIRFGFKHLGSPSLRRYILENQPALVLCGHCHSCGGCSKVIGNTLVVNSASDDRQIKYTHAAIIDLKQGELPEVTWLDPTPHSVAFMPVIGPKRFEKLREAGIFHSKDLFEADESVYKSIKFGLKRTQHLRALNSALRINEPVWLIDAQMELPEELIYYDVETGLILDDPISSVQQPWLIGAMSSDTLGVKQWCVPELKPQPRRKMYKEFIDYIKCYPNATLCSWSGTGFDNRTIRVGLRDWFPKAVKEWEKIPEIDLLKIIRGHMVLPIYNMSIETVAKWCGFYDTHENLKDDMDGFQVGLSYELYKRMKEPLDVERICRYNANDVLILTYIAKWFLQENKRRYKDSKSRGMN